MEPIIFEITPYQSVGPIKFGMSENDLAKAIGQPVHFKKNQLGEGNYQYRTFSVRLSVHDHNVVEAGFSRKADVRLDGIEIFTSPNALEYLINKDGKSI